MAKVLDGIDIMPININLHWREDGANVYHGGTSFGTANHFMPLKDQFDVEASALGLGDYLKLFLDNLQEIKAVYNAVVALLKKFGVINDGFSVEKLGDGTFFRIIVENLPAIIDLLKKLGVLDEKSARKFGDGKFFFDVIVPLFLKFLPFLLMLLKDEKPGNISDVP